MISFGQFITEARLAPLYHGTTLVNLNSILSNGIAPTTLQSNHNLRYPPNKTNINNWDKWIDNLPADKRNLYRSSHHPRIEHDHAGVSLSRSMKFSGFYNAGKIYDMFVIEIDQQRLSQNYKIVPFQYFQKRSRRPDPHGVTNEYEEFVITTKPISPKYFVAVHYRLRGLKGNEVVIDDLKVKYPHIQFKEMKEFRT